MHNIPKHNYYIIKQGKVQTFFNMKGDFCAARDTRYA